jgi:hypothetical protein
VKLFEQGLDCANLPPTFFLCHERLDAARVRGALSGRPEDAGRKGLWTTRGRDFARQEVASRRGSACFFEVCGANINVSDSRGGTRE